MILAKGRKSLQRACVIETGVSGFHEMTVPLLKMYFRKLTP